MNKKIIAAVLVFVGIVGCDSPEDDINIGEEIKVGEAVESNRIVLLNEKINIANGDGASVGGFVNGNYAFVSAANQDYDCDRTISSNTNGTTIDKNEVVCVDAGVTLSGNINMKGGTLVVYGTANLSNINGNKGTLVIAESGSFSINNLNINNQFSVINHSDNFNTSNLNVSGDMENYGDIQLNQININGNGSFSNHGALIINSSLQVNKDFYNYASLTVNGDLTINGGAEFVNDCKVIIQRNFTVNKDIETSGYIEVGNTLTVNGGGVITMAESAYIKTTDLMLNNIIEGPNAGFARVDVANRTTINGGGRLKNRIDFNDINGIEVNTGQIESAVTLNQDIYLAPTACNPGTVGVLAEPEYTLVADISVPQVKGVNLSATDVTYADGLAFISYHLNGNQYAGAIDVLNLANVNAPSFTVNYTSASREFNALNIYDDQLVLAGQRSKEESGYTANSTNGALLYVVDVVSGDQLENSIDWQEIPMPSFSGNSVDKIDNNTLLFASGASGGGFFEVNLQSGSITASEGENYAKYVEVVDGVKYKLVGGNGNASLIIEGNSGVTTIDLGASAMPVDGKNVIAVYDNKAYVTLGENGLVIVSLATNEVVGTYKYDGPGLANGVAVDEDFIYLANGQSGLILLRRRSLEYYGQYKYDGSANLVDVTDNVILIANGIGGVKLLLRDQ